MACSHQVGKLELGQVDNSRMSMVAEHMCLHCRDDFSDISEQQEMVLQSLWHIVGPSFRAQFAISEFDHNLILYLDTPDIYK